MKSMNKTTKFICQSAIIAALYVVLTYLANALGLANYAIQVRFSEALCALAIFTPAAIPGLFLGCLISNILTGCVIWDIIFGSIATLIGAIGTYLLRKHPIPALLPPIISNMVIVPLVLKFAYGLEDGLWFLILTVGAGEVISVGILGFILYKALKPQANKIFNLN